MIYLVNGRGQLGNSLKTRLASEDILVPEDTWIYHTWNFMNKSQQVQEECFRKFQQFVDDNPDKRIIFTSTYSQLQNYYNHYKQAAEAYLLSRNPKGIAVRIPIIIGKGICDKFRQEIAEPSGEMEIISLEDVTEHILNLCKADSLIKNIRLEGEKISAKMVKQLIMFGKYGR